MQSSGAGNLYPIGTSSSGCGKPTKKTSSAESAIGGAGAAAGLNRARNGPLRQRKGSLSPPGARSAAPGIWQCTPRRRPNRLPLRSTGGGDSRTGRRSCVRSNSILRKTCPSGRWCGGRACFAVAPASRFGPVKPDACASRRDRRSSLAGRRSSRQPYESGSIRIRDRFEKGSWGAVEPETSLPISPAAAHARRLRTSKGSSVGEQRTHKLVMHNNLQKA